MSTLNCVLLSASFPRDDRRDEWQSSASPQDIGLALSAVVEAVLARGIRLVFGGHPSVSPIVLNVALAVKARELVTVYQSEYFDTQVTAEVKRLIDGAVPGQGVGATRIVVPKGSGQQESMDLMREEMLRRPYVAAFFVGGMSGIEEECRRLGERQPACPRFVFTRPGGRAADLGLRDGVPIGPRPLERVSPTLTALNRRGYASLVFEALDGVLGEGT